MKFEFDHKTGTMQPKKDDQIYFAKSQGGGLIVDDKKNNIKYIIERDERITKLFGSFDKDSLNFYDMRDARMISDRVIRLFGRDHKYTDFHYFLKGYHMNENFVQKMGDFLDESVWGDIRKAGNGEVKREDGRLIGQLDDGTPPLIISNDAFVDGDLVDFDGSYLYTFDNDISVAIISDGNTDVYYSYDPELDEEKYNMRRCFDADSTLRTEHEFKPLVAFMTDVDNNDGWDNDNFYDMTVDVRSKWIDFSTSSWNKWRLFFDRDDAVSYAIDVEENFLDSEKPSKETIEHYRNTLGDDFFDTNSIESDLKEGQESYYDDLSEEDAIEELIRREVIEDSEDYFELDEDGEIDHTQPKFDYKDYKDKYVEKYIESIDDVVDEYIFHFGTDGIENYVDTGKLAALVIEEDGPESMIAGYDGVEREEEVDGTTYYIYRTE